MMEKTENRGRLSRAPGRRAGLTGAVLALAVLVLSFSARPAQAAICPECACAAAAHDVTRAYIAAQDELTRVYFGTADPVPIPPGIAPNAMIGTGAMGGDETWTYNYWFRGYIVPAFQLMTEQLVATMMDQVMAIGAQIDAKNQLATQLQLQRMMAEAHSDYQPSTGMCVIGTGIRSLAAAERTAVLSSHVFNEAALEREVGRGQISGAIATIGNDGDRNDRLQNFIANYCDYEDNDRLENQANSGLYLLCSQKPNPLDKVNLDISYGRAIAEPDTINLDMTDDAANQPNAILSLQKSLYGHDLMTRIPGALLKRQDSLDEIVDMRTVAAKRSVAENSFAAIVGLKAMGTKQGAGTGMGSADTLQYMNIIMKDLGIPDDEIKYTLGERPSYYAQLKFIAKRIYQRPEFFVDLYDTPANVERKKVALQAINSILERESYNSYLRSEAILSQISELHTADKQKDVENAIRAFGVQRQ
jgi:hypothetical protein